MIKDLPDEINAAIKLLWEYSDDACLSGRTRDECIEEGFDCTSENGAHRLTFIISRR
jgi:hypothetical protein